MGLDRFRASAPSAFDRFYDAFLQNSMQGKKYRITLRDGTTAEGVPTAGSFVNPSDLLGTKFSITVNGQQYEIPFRELADATPLS